MPRRTASPAAGAGAAAGCALCGPAFACAAHALARHALVERERLRKTPLNRKAHVVRPGFHERGLEQESLLRAQRVEEERLRLAAEASTTRPCVARLP